MAMLAERKQKQRWSLNPRGKYWSEDVNKFGHKMLEKMGWSAGKGLGAKLDGITEHVKVSYKNDARGMGFKDNGEQWTKHEDNFTSLLANLGAGDAARQIKLPKAEKSLEKQSQSSRARVHYHKQTRGKDLVSRSEKDIANIFGWKTLERPAPTHPAEFPRRYPQVTNGTREKSYGVETVRGGNMTEYFKSKLKQKKSCVVTVKAGNMAENSKLKSLKLGAAESNGFETVKTGNMAEYFKSKLGKIGNLSSLKGDYALDGYDDYESEIGACTGFGFSSSVTETNDAHAQHDSGAKSTQEETSEETQNNKRKRRDSEDEVTTEKKKKSKKLAFDNLGNNINPAEELCYDNPTLNPSDSPSPQNHDDKADKKKRVTFSSPITEVLNKSDESPDNTEKSQKKKKKKKNKQLTNGIDNLGCEENSFEELSNEANEKKTKKKKKQQLNNEVIMDVTPTKKKRKGEELGLDNLACEEISINEKNEEIKRYKLKKKAMEHGLVNPACQANDDSIMDEESPKKKKKSKENLEIEVEETEIQKKKKKKNENSLDVSNISDVSQNDEEVKTKKSKKNKKATEEEVTEKKKSKSKENGIENLGCEINTVEENIASINNEIDSYQTELENELNVKKVKKQKKKKTKTSTEDTSEDGQNQKSPNQKSKDNSIDYNEQNTNDESNFQKNSSSEESDFSDSGHGATNNNRFNHGPRGPNNFNRSFKGPNNFNSRAPRVPLKPRWDPDRVDKTALKDILKPGELILSFKGSNLKHIAGYGVGHELIGKIHRPGANNPSPTTETS